MAASRGRYSLVNQNIVGLKISMWFSWQYYGNGFWFLVFVLFFCLVLSQVQIVILLERKQTEINTLQL